MSVVTKVHFVLSVDCFIDESHSRHHAQFQLIFVYQCALTYFVNNGYTHQPHSFRLQIHIPRRDLKFVHGEGRDFYFQRGVIINQIPFSLITVFRFDK